MTSRKAMLSALCLAALFTQALHAREAGNGIVGRNPGKLPERSAVPLGGPWTEFSFSGVGSSANGCPAGFCTPSPGGNSVFGGDPPWTFTAPAEGATFTVTDAFDYGDQFEVLDFGVSIGTTSPPTMEPGACGDDPDPCLTDPLASHGSFALPPGPHEITIRMEASLVGGGAAYFRVDPSTAASPMDFHTLSPCRVVDTRSADGPYGGPALASSELRDFLIAGQCGIPEDARAVSLNITAVGPTGPGFLRIFASGTFEASTSILNFGAGQIRANNGIVGLLDGSLSVRAFVDASPGTVHVLIDVNGYFR